mmetsp:Transcript_28131/g.62045  ORF Transcript_28131/g.62045 Transcript_28131/m.62045 type:complete len:231 (-) Transcript_28131:196-888(-)
MAARRRSAYSGKVAWGSLPVKLTPRPPPMSSTRMRPGISLFTRSAKVNTREMPATRVAIPILPDPTWTCTQLRNGYFRYSATASSSVASSCRQKPNLESGVDTESAAISPDPEQGLIRRPTTPGKELPILATRSSSLALSQLIWMPLDRANFSSPIVFTGESSTILSLGHPAARAIFTSPMDAASTPKPSSTAIFTMDRTGLDLMARACKNPFPNAASHDRIPALHAAKS